jgi:hypothetical protein
VEWIPRTKNERADFISRIVDADDWGISEDLFLYVDSLWGPHEIDWFANDDNHKLPIFYSRYWNVKSIGIDAFTNCSLSDHIPWAILSGLSTIYPPNPVELASLCTIVLQETSVVNLRTLMSFKLFFQKRKLL